MDLANQKIVVLGGTSGIGFAVAKKAAAQGAAIIVASPARGQRKSSRSFCPVRPKESLLTSQARKHQIVFRQIGEFNHLVYTAGESLLTERLETLSLSARGSSFDIPVLGAFLAVKYGAPSIRRGSIVLSSGMGIATARKGSERDIKRMWSRRSAHTIARSRIGAAPG